MPVQNITVKQLQTLLKLALNKTSETDFNKKLGMSEFDPNCILKVRKDISNVKLRNVFYRLINNDFFTRVKMLKFKMTETAECERCGKVETTKHLLWECPFSQMAWKNYNEILEEINLGSEKIVFHEQIFDFRGSACANLIKLKLVNEFIQLERPKNLTKDRISTIIKMLINTEKYIAIKNQTIKKFEERWKPFL